MLEAYEGVTYRGAALALIVWDTKIEKHIISIVAIVVLCFFIVLSFRNVLSYFIVTSH